MKKAFANNMKISSPTGTLMQPRGCDPAGCGHYGASRKGHKHQGLDVKITPGQPVYAPVNGWVRTLRVYAGSDEMKGVEIANSDVSVKIFYMLPHVTTGQYVYAGQKIGTAQNVAEYYGNPNMTPHLHIEVREKGHLIDPVKIFKNLLI